MWSLVLPSCYTLYPEYAGLCSWRRDTYTDFSGKYSTTILLEGGRAGDVDYTCLRIKSATIKSYRKFGLISTPVREWNSDRSREIPYTTLWIYSIWSRRDHSCESRNSYTSCDIVFHLPAVYLITRESEPVGIAYISHWFYPFAGDIYRFYVVLSISCISDPSWYRLEKCRNPETKDDQNYHKFYYGSSLLIIKRRGDFLCYSPESVVLHSFIIVKSCVERSESLGPKNLIS